MKARRLLGAIESPWFTRRLALGAVWILASNGVYALCQWGVIVLLARLASMDAVGEYGLALAVTAPVMLLSSMRLRSLIATDLQAQFRASTYFGAGGIAVLIALGVVGLLAAAVARDGAAAATIIMVGGAKAADNMAELFHGVLQRDERLGGIAVLMASNGFLTLIGAWVGLRLIPTATTVAIASALASSIVLMASASTAVPNIASRIDGICRAWMREGGAWLERWKTSLVEEGGSLLGATLPLTVVAVCASLSVNAPRYFVDAWLDADQLGLYTALSYPVLVGSLAVNAVVQAVTPRLARYHLSGAGEAFRRLLLMTVGAGVAIGLITLAVLILWGEEIVMLLYGPEYAAQHRLLVLLAIGGGIVYSHVFLGTGVNAMRVFKPQWPVALAGAAAVILLSAVLVPSLRLTGAALAVVGGAVVQAGMAAVVFIPILRRAGRAGVGGRA